MKAIRTIVIIVMLIVCIQLFWIIGKGIFGYASVMVPDSRPGSEQLGDAMHECGEWFHEHSGRTRKQQEESMNAAGLYWNEEAGRYEEDPERYSKYLDSKFGKIGE